MKIKELLKLCFKIPIKIFLSSKPLLLDIHGLLESYDSGFKAFKAVGFKEYR